VISHVISDFTCVVFVSGSSLKTNISEVKNSKSDSLGKNSVRYTHGAGRTLCQDQHSLKCSGVVSLETSWLQKNSDTTTSTNSGETFVPPTT
jgi:hypothetical protein